MAKVPKLDFSTIRGYVPNSDPSQVKGIYFQSPPHRHRTNRQISGVHIPFVIDEDQSPVDSNDLSDLYSERTCTLISSPEPIVDERATRDDINWMKSGMTQFTEPIILDCCNDLEESWHSIHANPIEDKEVIAALMHKQIRTLAALSKKLFQKIQAQGPVEQAVQSYSHQFSEIATAYFETIHILRNR